MRIQKNNPFTLGRNIELDNVRTWLYKNKYYMFGTSDLAMMIKYQIIIMMVSIIYFFHFILLISINL